MADRQLFIPPGYIEGLKLEWVSGTSLRVTAGCALVPGYGGLVAVPASITKATGASGMPASFAANTFYYAYLQHTANGEGTFVLSTDPPSGYWGDAKCRNAGGTPNEDYRYLGAVKTNSTPRMWCFQHFPRSGDMFYRGEDMRSSVAPWGVFDGTAPAAGTVARLGNTHATAANRLVPPTSKLAWLMWNVGGNNNSYVQTDEDPLADSAATTGEYAGHAANATSLRPITLNSNQEFIVDSNALFAYVKGYREDR